MYVAITGKGKAKVIQFCEQHRIPKTNKKKTVVIKTIENTTHTSILEKQETVDEILQFLKN